ncbi:EAL domain-containing protein [Lutibaculum baratangense]|uniref:Diguanylate cyclase/phosphodiesterase (GGDEF & EAL domains) with PAS/PAC sensor(S) n=1 Tax=Lutibaculum baratangense AMV1 TaxID=631454 RepID=V4R942_9HYPH|nr:EAL domain-containing protein [Lutibaculum baratangense]ESR22716.1 diguanylate cyclase/phosphodiesterase (GGDEF & EAL domains) with PAS/PAC sensor(s) [Lutibaculum baratangense AMV1]
MSIRLKLLAGSLVLTLVTIVLGGYAHVSQREVGTLAMRIYDETFLSLDHLRSAQNALVELRADYRMLDSSALARNDELESGNGFATYGRRLPHIIADLESAAGRSTSSAGRARIEALHADLVALQEGSPRLSRRQLLDQLLRIDRELETAVETFADDGLRLRREIGGLVSASMHEMAVAVAVAAAIALAASVLLSGMIVPPLNRAVKVAKAIAEGRLDNEITPGGRGETADLLGALATMQDGIAAQLQRIQDLMAAQAKTYDHRIALQNARFQAALNNMSQGLCMFDENERLVVFNRRFAQMFGGFRLGASASQVLLSPEIKHILAPGTDAAFTHELPDGRVISMTRQMIPEGGWVDTFEDITERRLAERRLSHMALHDGLTGLPNRVQFRETLAAALRDHECRGVAVLCLDLDGFKTVNDALGHPVGDALLKAAAGRLLGATEEGDLVARLGGDEFAVIRRGPGAAETAEAMARSMIALLAEPFRLGDHLVTAGVSVGIAASGGAHRAEMCVDTLIKNADLALYRAKSDGRGTYRFFEPEMDRRLQARRRIELDLRGALERGELELHYQPFVDVSARTVTGVEALLRWTHKERGPVSPAEFIPVAEESGLIRPLGLWVLREACRQAAAWPQWLDVSVNLSPVQFRTDSLVGDVRSILAETGLDPRRLQLEVTESLLLQDTQSVLVKLQAFRDLGIRISMDDFGTGYSSLGYISKFPFDKIKIDQSFVRDIEKPDSLAIIRAVIGLSRALGIAVIAEGVETEAQRDALRTEGCHEMQGYFFAKPQPAPELAGSVLRIARGFGIAEDALPDARQAGERTSAFAAA